MKQTNNAGQPQGQRCAAVGACDRELWPLRVLIWMQTLKTVVVGDGAVGKTTLLLAKTYNCFSQDYVPTVFDNFAVIVPVGGRPVGIGLWDTAGQEDYDKVRQASYGTSGEVDLALVLFSVVNPASFENLRGKWFPEVKKYAPHVPIILVGTKTDLRNDEATVKKLNDAGKNPISTETARKFAKKHDCVSYLECSSVAQTGVSEVFLEIVRTHINFRAGKRPGKWCWDPSCDKPLGLTTKKFKCRNCLLKYCPDHVDKLKQEGKKGKEEFICHKCAGKPITTVLDERRRLREEQEKAEAEARAKEAAAAAATAPSGTTPAPASSATPAAWDAGSSSSSSDSDKPDKPEKPEKPEKEDKEGVHATSTPAPAPAAPAASDAAPAPAPAASTTEKKDAETDSQHSRGLAAAPADLQAEGSGPKKSGGESHKREHKDKDKKKKHGEDKTKKHDSSSASPPEASS